MKRRRIEFLLFTGVTVFILAFIYSRNIAEAGLQKTMAIMGYVIVLYSSCMAFNLWICPVFFRIKKIETGIAYTLLLFFITWLGLAAAWWVIKGTRPGGLPDHFVDGPSLGGVLLAFACFGVYQGLWALISSAFRSDSNLKRRVAREVLFVLLIGAGVFFLLLSTEKLLALLWLIGLPYVYLLYALNMYWLLPVQEKKHLRFYELTLFILIVSLTTFVPFGFMLSAPGYSGTFVLVFWLVINLLVLPFSFFLYHSQRSQIAQMLNLQTELGRTSADLTFLRSQINPHFLFNVLNTLYGTALQEEADRTANGIQKLGDMMRFMLHENHHDKVLLSREADYLNNYISLQLLRTLTSPTVTVKSDISPVLEDLYIAPMLLIPFVENAFKHGISLQEPSWINISLRTESGTVHLDVYNSMHIRGDQLLEKGKSGIGLDHVKQRLQLVYADSHELVIRRTAEEYFVHLTIRLS